MFSALIYLQLTTLKNRARSHLRRFKQPKYWLGAAVFGLYLWTIFLRHLLPGGRTPRWGSAGAGLDADVLFGLEHGFALLLLGIVLLAWLLPKDRAALDFTEAEIAFLFPAPVSRKTLIHFKLLKWQLGNLVGALFFTVFSSRGAGGGTVVRHILAWWLVMATLNLHTVAASFARTMLLDRGITTWKRRLFILAALSVVTVGVALWLRGHVPPFGLQVIQSKESFIGWLHEVVDNGPLFWLLLPFRVVLKPFFTPDAAGFALACLPLLGLMLAHYVWVVRSDTAFEEATVEQAARRANIIAAAKAGSWAAMRAAAGKVRRGRPLFTLRSDGFRPVALLWKNLIAVGNVLSLRVWMVVGVVVFAAAVFGRFAYSDLPLLPVMGIAAPAIAGYLFFFGPQLLRQDLRTDLAQPDLLKVLPLPGWQVVLGSVLAPVTVMTAVQWFLLATGGVLLTGGEASAKLPLTNLIGFGFAAALVLPLVNFTAFLVLNGAVLAFPAWFTLGQTGAQGFEQTGQRMIMAIGQMFVLLAALVLPGAAFAMGFVLGKLFAGVAVATVLGALGAALVLAAECAAGVWALGGLFDRFDSSAESAP
jgi:hypothetical protein